MRKPVVNYKEFRISKLNEPQFKHLQYLFGWVGYFTLYFLTENLIPYDKCYPVHCALDDKIPFCEYFAISYVGWYFLIAFALVFFALYNPENFKNLMKFIITVQVLGMIIYIVFPNRQDLRPEMFTRDNVFTRIIGFLYSFDTSTNVCPSMHVAYSVGIASTWLKEPSVSRWSKVAMVMFCLSVCVSVAFVKQHSVIDIFAAIPLCIFAEWFVFKKWKG